MVGVNWGGIGRSHLVYHSALILISHSNLTFVSSSKEFISTAQHSQLDHFTGEPTKHMMHAYACCIECEHVPQCGLYSEVYCISTVLFNVHTQAVSLMYTVLIAWHLDRYCTDWFS